MRLDEETRLYKGVADTAEARRAVLLGHLSRRLGLDAADLVLEREPGGRPFLRHPAGHWFGTASRDGLLLVADSSRGRVGADIETLDRCRAAWKEASRLFAPAERAALDRLPAARRPLAFARLWTAKEAVLKARGIGLTAGLAEPDLSGLPDLDAAGPWHPKLLNLGDETYVVTWYMLNIDEAVAVAARADTRD